MCSSMFFRSISRELYTHLRGMQFLPILACNSRTIGSLRYKCAFRLRLACGWLDFNVGVVFDLAFQVQVFIPQALYFSERLLKLFPQPPIVLL
jgi:hypothetical protein